MDKICSAQSDITITRTAGKPQEVSFSYDGDTDTLDYLASSMKGGKVTILGRSYSIESSVLKTRAGKKASLSVSATNRIIRSELEEDESDDASDASPLKDRENAQVSVTMSRENVAIEEKAYQDLNDEQCELLGNMYSIVDAWKNTSIAGKKKFIITDRDNTSIDLHDNPYFDRISFILKRIEKGITQYSIFKPVISVKFVSNKPPSMEYMGRYIDKTSIGGIPTGGLKFVLTGCNSSKIELTESDNSVVYGLDGSVIENTSPEIKERWQIEYVFEGYKYVDYALYRPWSELEA